jgi:hexulose-6-phosphate isomerase
MDSPFLAVNQHSLPAALGLGDAFRLARDAGFDGFEPVVRETGELASATDDAGVARALALARDAGLRIRTLSCDVWFRSPLTDPDPDVRRRGRIEGERMVEMAARIGAEVLHVIPGMVDMPLARPDYPPVPYDDVMSRAIEAVAALARKAESEGVLIGLENVWNRFLQSPLEMRALVDSANSDAVTAFFDVGNCLAIGYPEHWIRILGQERLGRVHFKDFRRAAGIVSAAGFVAPFAGDVNWPAVMAALDDVRYDGPLTVEVACEKNTDPATHLRALAGALRRLDALRRAE